MAANKSNGFGGAKMNLYQDLQQQRQYAGTQLKPVHAQLTVNRGGIKGNTRIHQQQIKQVVQQQFSQKLPLNVDQRQSLKRRLSGNDWMPQSEVAGMPGENQISYDAHKGRPMAVAGGNYSP